ncbi:MAG: hypothetical protein FWC39_12180 [Bacteroidetes bacterium]|nr:hypothetical protein [Bacteroidota bacterium]
MIPAIFIPSVVFAHNPGGALMSWVMMFGISLVASLFLLKKIRRRITIENKFLRFSALFAIEIVLLFCFMVVLSSTLGIWIYVNLFGG